MTPYRNQEQVRSVMMNMTNLFVQGLPLGITDTEVRAMFAEFGEVKSLTVRNPQVPQQSPFQVMAAMTNLHSIAYVTMETQEQAKASFALNTRDPS